MFTANCISNDLFQNKKQRKLKLFTPSLHKKKSILATTMPPLHKTTLQLHLQA